MNFTYFSQNGQRAWFSTISTKFARQFGALDPVIVYTCAVTTSGSILLLKKVCIYIQHEILTLILLIICGNNDIFREPKKVSFHAFTTILCVLPKKGAKPEKPPLDTAQLRTARQSNQSWRPFHSTALC